MLFILPNRSLLTTGAYATSARMRLYRHCHKLSRELLHLLGTPLMMDELYTLDASTLTSDPLSAISPIVALVFLFKWTAEREGQDVAVGEGERGPKTGGVYTEEFNGFFAKQVSGFLRRRVYTLPFFGHSIRLFRW